jgi:hypothetical protein
MTVLIGSNVLGVVAEGNELIGSPPVPRAYCGAVTAFFDGSETCGNVGSFEQLHHRTWSVSFPSGASFLKTVLTFRVTIKKPVRTDLADSCPSFIR